MSWTLLGARSIERVSWGLFQRNMCCDPFACFSAWCLGLAWTTRRKSFLNTPKNLRMQQKWKKASKHCTVWSANVPFCAYVSYIHTHSYIRALILCDFSTQSRVSFSWCQRGRFFSETGAGKHVPRCVMVDLEPTVTQMCLSKAFFLSVSVFLGVSGCRFLTESTLRVHVFHVCMERQNSWQSGFLKTGGWWSSHWYVPPAVPSWAIDLGKRRCRQ